MILKSLEFSLIYYESGDIDKAIMQLLKMQLMKIPEESLLIL